VVLDSVSLPGPSTGAADPLTVIISKLAEHRFLFDMRVAAPGSFDLLGVSHAELHLTENNASLRNEHVSYQFPEAKPPRTGVLGTVHWNPVSVLRVTVTDERDFAVVGLDPSSLRYRIVELPR
jgi:hypothetical protein